jgi:hypothetical protein
MAEISYTRECVARRSNKTVLSFEPKYNLPSLANYNKVFAGEKNDLDENSDRLYSVVGIKITTYEKDKSAVCTANIRPEKLDFLLEMCRWGMTTGRDVQIEQEVKCIACGGGNAKVTKLSIARQQQYTGKIKTYPWMITVENGTGKIQQGANGTTSVVSGSYKVAVKGTAQLKDEEFYELLVRCIEHKTAWIMTHYVRFLRDSERIIAEMSASQNI